MRFQKSFCALVAAVLVAGCAPDVDIPEQAGIGTSGLAPSIAADPPGGRKQHKSPKREAGRSPGSKPGKGEPAASSSAVPRPRSTTSAAPAAIPTATARTLSASVTDPSGDVKGSLTEPPAHVDLTGATLTREGAFELRVSFAAAVPSRDDGSHIVNVASFFDIDGDGQVDYEVWASLADDGWSGSYRTPSGARFGSDSGVTARPAGNDLVLTFPLAHLKRSSTFRWSVGAEWGTYEQVAAGVTAHDTAPDQGVVAFPG